MTAQKSSHYLLAGLLILMIAGCRGSIDTEEQTQPGPQSERSTLLNEGATVIAYHSQYQLIDYVHVPGNTKIKRIEFRVPSNLDKIHVDAVGPNRSEALKNHDMVITGPKVTVEVEEGAIQSISGKSIARRRSVPTAIERVKRKLADASHDYRDTTRIVMRDEYRAQLVKDQKGNRIPSDPSDKELELIQAVRAALKSSCIAPLEPFCDFRKIVNAAKKAVWQRRRRMSISR